jgi:hypothetical protein
MKQLLLLAFILFFISCNNSNETSVGNKTTGPVKVQSTATANEGSPGNANTCSKLIFFQPGAEIEATSYDKDGKESSKQYTKILTVANEDGFTVANVEGKNTQSNGEKKTTTVRYNYKCDGNKIYFDVASMFRTAKKEQDAPFESSLIEYPINVREGEVLPAATGTMSSVRDGKKMTMKFIYKDRKVEGREVVTTSAGSWNCYKISNSVESEMDMPGMDEKTKEIMKKMRESMKASTTTWFAPDFGIVKMEMYMNGKLQSKSEVTSVKY